jgi:hypothetical protein
VTGWRVVAIAAFAAFIIAGLVLFTGQHTHAFEWLMVIGGILVSAAVAWGWAGSPLRKDG